MKTLNSTELLDNIERYEIRKEIPAYTFKDEYRGLESVKVIIQDVKGKIIKGYTNDFHPNISAFHVFVMSDQGKIEEIRILMQDIKLIFFLDDIQKNLLHDEQKFHSEKKQTSSDNVKVHFVDGDVVIGKMILDNPNCNGFFLHSIDSQRRVFITSAAVKRIQYI